jgi:hypothetical protein
LYREIKFVLLAGQTDAKLFAILRIKKEAVQLPFLENLEREKSLELSTSTLARLRSTN